MKNIYYLFILIVILNFGCQHKKAETTFKYFSVNKTVRTRYAYEISKGKYNFYLFQNSIGDILINDSTYIETQFIDEKVLNDYLKCNFLKYEHSKKLLQKMSELSINDDRDSVILVLDLLVTPSGDSISLLSMGSLFSTGPWGSAFSGRENYLIKQKNDSIVFISPSLYPLPQGNLKGLFLDEKNKPKRLVFEDFRHYSYESGRYDGGNIVFELEIVDNELRFLDILNYRNGEPADYTDSTYFLNDLRQFSFKL